MNFKLVSDYRPTGDQPQAIELLSAGVESGLKEQTLLGVTGSGKTFTMANVIANVNKPTLVLAHNKTLAAQLCSELRELFPENAVEYFVSYYDYYQPEAYIPGKDIYIEKDSSVNDEIDRLRHSATTSLFERRDVIIVASVSCIYSLGDPMEYQNEVISLREGAPMSREELVSKLIHMQYDRNDVNFVRDTFRVRGDIVDVLPAANDKKAIRVEFFGDEIDRISEINVVTGELIRSLGYYMIFPATHYAIAPDKREAAFAEIEREMEDRAEFYRSQNRLLEAQRITERTKYDLEMLREVGYCSGVENYSRVLSGRAPGSTPYCLLDYFPKDFLMIIDESHVSLPQVRGMSGGDRARKTTLVEYGFRLPSAFDNRPLFFNEFENKINQVIYVSATPGEYERKRSSQIVEQLIRPTGLVDPPVEVRPVEGQIEDLMNEIRKCVSKNQRVLVTTLTKKMAEDLTEYFEMNLINVRYIHHNVETMERTELIRDLRLGVFDVLVGVNLLREGLDIPEVALVAILDADKEGFLRGETALIQTIGRAARNSESRVIMYADSVTSSMKAAIDETERRRKYQMAFNSEHGITPQTIIKPVRELIDLGEKEKDVKGGKKKDARRDRRAALPESVPELEKQMYEAAERLDFEKAAELRDRIKLLKKED